MRAHQAFGLQRDQHDLSEPRFSVGAPVTAWLLIATLVAFGAAACDDPSELDDPGPGTEVPVNGGDEETDDPDEPGDGENGEEPDDGEPGGEEPSGPRPPALPEYSWGECPPMTAGAVAIRSGSLERQVYIDMPDEPAGAPVLFVFHGAGSNAAQFVTYFRTAQIAREFGAVVVTPTSTGLFQVEWPFLTQEDSAVDTGLFTDVLVCLEEEHGVDLTRVYTTGFSAGGLWSTHLMMHMSEHLAAAAIFSGGTASAAGGYHSPTWPIPVLATHGGETDQVVLRFDLTTDDMVTNLLADGHLVVLCTHEQGHTIPWDIPSLMMPFLLSHSWQVPDTSAADDGLDDGWPGGCVVAR